MDIDVGVEAGLDMSYIDTSGYKDREVTAAAAGDISVSEDAPLQVSFFNLN